MTKKCLAKWYKAANIRRGELIHKSNRGLTTEEEEQELSVLQDRCGAEVSRVCPPPELPSLDRIEKRLKLEASK